MPQSQKREGGEVFCVGFFCLFTDKQLVIDFSEAANTNLLTATEVKQADATVPSRTKSNLFVQLTVLFTCLGKYLIVCLGIK